MAGKASNYKVTEAQKLVKKAEKLAVEDVKLDAAVRMYIASYGLLQEGQDQMAFASYQTTASIYIMVSRMDSFFKSDQTQCVVQILSVYQEGRQDGMKHVVITSCLCHSLP